MLEVKCKSWADVSELVLALKSPFFVDWRHNRVYLGSGDLEKASEPLYFENSAQAKRISATDQVRELCNARCLIVYQLENMGLVESYLDTNGCRCFEVKK